jgi:hypothetical protein
MELYSDYAQVVKNEEEATLRSDKDRAYRIRLRRFLPSRFITGRCNKSYDTFTANPS